MTRNRTFITCAAAIFVAVLCFCGCLLCGSVDIPAKEVLSVLCGGDASRSAWTYIIIETRLPAAITALFTGAALGVSGLLMQTTFSNPLAGPSILGVSTGASLGVAIVMLWVVGGTLAGQFAVLGAALAGALLVMAILAGLSAVVRSSVMLLIVGILLGYLSGSAISLLNFFASEEGIHAYVIWGMGTFGNVSLQMLPVYLPALLIPLLLSLLCVKQLNALLLGSRYAESVGVNVKTARAALVLIAGALAAFTTAWCGPIGFIGLAVPHVARMATKSSNHIRLLPATMAVGAAVGVLCLLISILPGKFGILPLNSITPLLGVPVIIYIIVKRRTITYFN